MTDITSKVTGKVQGLSITRDGNKIKATFKVPSWLTDSESSSRATWVDHELRMDRDGAKPVSLDVGAWNGPDINRTDADRFWIRGQGTESSIEKSYDRSRFHPVANGKYCKLVKWGTFAGNPKCGSGWGASMQNIGPVVWTSRAVKLPRKPTVSWSYDKDNSEATVTIKTDEGKDWCERYDTVYQITLRKADGTEETLKKWASSRATEVTLTYDLSSYLAEIASGKYVTIKCQAYARGMAGDNPAKADAVTGSRSVYWPSKATIGTIKCSSKTSTGRITVPVTPGKKFASSTQLQLQRATSEDKDWDGITPAGSWSDVSDATDDGDAKALYDTYADANPQPGVYTFYRIASTRDQFTQYSSAKRADCLYTAKPKVNCSATVGIVSVTPSSGGTQASVVMGWSDATVNSDWELSWSDNRGAWNSTEPPSAYNSSEMQPSEKEDSSSKSKKYDSTKTLNITGLTPGETYYVRVRRYRTVDSETFYSKYSSIFSFTTESAQDDRCGIISITPTQSGNKATVIVGYTEDNANTGTELSYSTSSGSWSSSAVPPTVITDDSEGSNSSTKWKKQVSIAIDNENHDALTQGTTYYVRARRYKSGDNIPTTYSPYSAIQKFTTESATGTQAFIISVDPGTSGKTATVVVGFSETSESTGTQIQWSTDKNAWKSNVEPENMLATWGRTSWSGSEYQNSYKQTSYLRNLTPGKTYYIKARRYMEAGGTTSYGNWSPVQSFTTPKATAANDKCGIVSVTKHSDGLGANVVVGWTEDTANDGTELSWSTDKDAWRSNKQPETMQATWSDKESQSSSWAKTQKISLHGLERGETYYIRARRYLDDDDGTTYSPYAPTTSITLPAEKKSEDDVRCGLVSVTGLSDGTSAEVVVGWDGDHTGCEVTWSKDPNAWESSEPPKSTTFDWQDEKNKSWYYEKTSDTSIKSGKNYYTRSGSGTDASPYVYTKVQSPVAASLSTYYERKNRWGHTSTLYLRDLEEGETYYVKARSYHESSDGTTWSDYTEDMSVTPFSAPESVTLSAPSAVARGKSIDCYWEVSSELEQAEWAIHKVGQRKKSIASGSGSLCHASIPASKYNGLSTISFFVSSSCGGGFTDSNTVSVGIADYPSCEAACAATLTSQPSYFEVYTDNNAATLICVLRANGITVSAPDGDRDQLAGDVVWSDTVTPLWSSTTWNQTMLRSQLASKRSAALTARNSAISAATFTQTTDTSVNRDTTYYAASGGSYVKKNPTGSENPSTEGWYVIQDAAENLAVENAISAYADADSAYSAHPSAGACIKALVTLPDGLELWDGATYTLSVQAVEPVASLVSETAECEFAVGWSHQAVTPTATVTPDVTDRSVAITLSSPTGATSGDVYDVYRTVPGGHVLVASSIPLTGSVADPYAPFGMGNLHYRIALRTPDGDFEFADFPYEMKVGGSRFDWGGSFVELPYNVQLSESYSKDHETRSHADGSVNGYYGPSVEMSGSVASDVVKVDHETLQLLREMAKFPGAVFCRSSNGLAFQCNANVSELGTSYISGAVPVSIDLTYENLTEQYKCNGGDTA